MTMMDENRELNIYLREKPLLIIGQKFLQITEMLRKTKPITVPLGEKYGKAVLKR
jgi:hypothetical protein